MLVFLGVDPSIPPIGADSLTRGQDGRRLPKCDDIRVESGQCNTCYSSNSSSLAVAREYDALVFVGARGCTFMQLFFYMVSVGFRGIWKPERLREVATLMSFYGATTNAKL